MTGISTSIELYDKVSAPIYKMLSALDNLTSAFESMEASMDGSFDTSQIESARRSIESAALDVVRLGGEIEENEDSQRKYNNSVRDGESAMDGLLGKVMGFVAAYASLQGIKSLMDTSDEFVQTTARIGMMNSAFNEVNGTAMETDDLINLIYQSAQNARGSFNDMASVVAKFGNNARDAFSSQEEVVAFANLIQKQMTIAGASTAEASNAMLQLSQALGSGTLRGDELNSIFEQAPNLIQSIADYLDVPIGKIREMASEGQLSASIVKNAIFAATDDIEEQFENIPMTWGQVWTTMKNGALMQFQPILNKINELANNEQFQEFASAAVSALSVVANVLLEIIEFIAGIYHFFADNWSTIEPIISGIASALAVLAAAFLIWKLVTLAQAAAQWVMNSALLACPITWIVLAVAALIGAIIGVCTWLANTKGVAESAFGVISGGVWVAVQAVVNAFYWCGNLVFGVWNWLTAAFNNFVSFWVNLFYGCVNWISALWNNCVAGIVNVAMGLWNSISAIAENIGIAFQNAWIWAKNTFWEFIADVLRGVSKLEPVINGLAGLLGGEGVDFGGLIDAAEGKKGTYKAFNSISEAWDEGMSTRAYENLGDAWSSGWNTYDTFQDGWASEAFQTGSEWGDGIAETVSSSLDGLTGGFSGGTSNIFDGSGYGGYDAEQLPSNVADIAESAGSMADSMEIASEDLKYLRDIAESEAVNRFTTAEIKIEMTNNNNISSDMDLDGIVDYLTVSVNEAMEKAAEGVHS